MCCHGEIAIRGKTDGGGCGGDKEIRSPNLLSCKGYIEFSSSGKNVMCMSWRLTLPFDHVHAKIYH